MDTIARVVTGKLGAWLVLIAYVVLFGGVSGALGSVQTADRDQNLPPNAQSAIADTQLSQFPKADTSAVLLVTTRADGASLTPADQQAIAGVAATVHGVPKATVSDDGLAAITIVPVPASNDDSSNKQVISDLRTTVADHLPQGLTMQVTGGPAFGADIADSFSGADVTLLLVTVSIVAVLLLITYRSPMLWLLPLVIVGLADRLAQTLSNVLSVATGWHAEGGIVSVLVFGAGTNYALLMISRYREELHRHENHREALRVAWRRSLPAIIASNLTVVGGMLTLLVALLPNTRGLGLSSAVGLLVAVLAVLVALPAFLAIVGRRIFWPFVPRVTDESTDGRQGFWGFVARAVTSRPIVSLVAGLAVLGIFATGLLGVKVGLNQADQFRIASESATGLKTVAAHFPAGETSPVTIVGRADQQAALIKAAQQTPGVVRVVPTGADTANGRVSLQVTGSPTPGSDESLQLVRDLRATTGAVAGGEAVVGGQTAQDLDRRDAQNRDFWLIAPLILLVCWVVITLLTRSAIAPVLLLAINAASAAAAVGAGWWLSRAILDTPAYAIEVPLFAFLFLVALGVDYTIFLVERIRHGVFADHRTTRQATVEAVRHTGAVITSAGVVLAAVFAALGVLPLVVMGQLGIIVCLGVLVDTLIVRTVIVPALFALVGDRIWWPSRTARD